MRMMFLALLATLVCCAETRFYVDQRGDYGSGKAYGKAGIYEFITTRVVTDAGQGTAEVIKPRDPQTGNATLLLEVNGKGKLTPPEAALNSGTTIVRLNWPDAKSLPQGVQEIVNFLKYKGGPMLLGDQRNFLKKAVVIDNGPWVAGFAKSDRNTGEKGRPLFDAALRGADARSMDVAKAQPITK